MVAVALLAFLSRTRGAGTAGAGGTLLPSPPPRLLRPQHVLIYKLFRPFLRETTKEKQQRMEVAR